MADVLQQLRSEYLKNKTIKKDTFLKAVDVKTSYEFKMIGDRLVLATDTHA